MFSFSIFHIKIIAGDVNFAPTLRDLRYSHSFHIVVLHGYHPSEALLSMAHEAHNFTMFIDTVPMRRSAKQAVSSAAEQNFANQVCTVNNDF